MVEKEVKIKHVNEKIKEMKNNKYKILRTQNPEF